MAADENTSVTPEDDAGLLGKSEEDLYELAMSELKSEARRAGLWARAFSETDGDERKAEALYIRNRAAQLIEEQARQKEAAAAAECARIEAERKVKVYFKCPKCHGELYLTKGQIAEVCRRKGSYWRHCRKCHTDFEVRKALESSELDLDSIRQAATRKVDEDRPELRGISGWLVLPAIGLVLGPIWTTYSDYASFTLIRSLTPEVLDNPKVLSGFVLDAILVLATVIVAFLFFGKRQEAVRAMIGLMVVSVVASFIGAILMVDVFGEADIESIKPVLQTGVYAAIWIPYFLKSQRVRNTFVN